LQKAQFLEYCFCGVYKLDCSISSEQISEFESFLKKAQTGTKFLFFDSIELLKDRDKIIFYPSVNKNEDNKKLYLNKSIKFGDCTFLLNKVENDYHLDDNLLVEKICGDNIQLPLTVRSWQRGDYFYPLGSNNRQKLSDFFINNKVTRINKKKIPIICNGNQIVWIAGFRIDDRYKLTSQCNSVLQIEMTYE
jgi:tRNA(Ile)-lysidine synthase